MFQISLQSLALQASLALSAAAQLEIAASFTQYGSADTWGSGNCNVASTACGFYTKPGGYAAAVSENFYGVGPGAGPGPACGTCWKLTVQKDSSGKPLPNAGISIVVMVNNLCPASGNPLCSQKTQTSTNQYGAVVNFDLCMDSGASKAMFGNDGVGLATGSASRVDCSQWVGSTVGNVPTSNGGYSQPKPNPKPPANPPSYPPANPPANPPGSGTTPPNCPAPVVVTSTVTVTQTPAPCAKDLYSTSTITSTQTKVDRVTVHPTGYVPHPTGGLGLSQGNGSYPRPSGTGAYGPQATGVTLSNGSAGRTEAVNLFSFSMSCAAVVGVVALFM